MDRDLVPRHVLLQEDLRVGEATRANDEESGEDVLLAQEVQEFLSCSESQQAS
jgi:hypothetical protein